MTKAMTGETKRRRHRWGEIDPVEESRTCARCGLERVDSGRPDLPYTQLRFYRWCDGERTTTWYDQPTCPPDHATGDDTYKIGDTFKNAPKIDAPPAVAVNTTAVNTTAVNTTAVNTTKDKRKGDRHKEPNRNRHSPGYMAAYMRRWRAKRMGQ
jgi:hypothetical protein